MYDKQVFFVSDIAFSRPLPTSARCVETLFLYFFIDAPPIRNTNLKKTASR